MNYTPNEPPRTLTAAEIEKILPHRYPFALVDKILDYTPGQWARGIKCVTRTESFFQGHFPGHPVMPGVLILEALAQTGAVAALSLPENRGKIALFGGVKNARFRRQVVPGDVLTVECELVEQHGPVGIGKATAWVDGVRAANAELTFVITDAWGLVLHGGLCYNKFISLQGDSRHAGSDIWAGIHKIQAAFL